jgi:branched-chain amino acid transport system permease protein
MSRLTEPRVYCALAALSLLLGIPAVSGSTFVVHVFVTICVFGALSTAWNILGGYAGQLSLGHTAYYGIGGYTAALLLQHFGLSPWLGMPVGAILAAAVSLVIGYPCFRLKGPFFSLATIAFLEVIRLLAIHFNGLTGGSAGLVVPLNLGWEWMIFREKFNYLYIAFGLLALCLAVSWAIRNSRLGYYLTAVRERDNAAQAAGVNITSVKLAAISISAALTAFVGAFHAMYMTFLEPETLFSLSTAIEVAMFALIGGLGTVAGPLLGTILLMPLAEFARGWLGASANGLHGFVYGTVLVLITLTVPGGLVGTFGQRFAALIDRLPGGGRRRPEVAAQAPANISGTLGAPILVARDLVKNFGGLVAANNVSLTLHRGEILGVIGPNGAGKTTVFGLLSGFQKQDAGTVEVIDKNGIGRFPDTPDGFARLGVGRTFQIVQPFGKLSVLENIMIGAFLRHPKVEDARAAALRVAKLVGLEDVSDVEAGTLPIGGLKRLEVARTLATEPSILLLDEVMAGQSHADTQRMVKLIRDIRDSGVSVIAIEHNMQAIMSLSDRIVVIDSGRVIAQGAPQDVVREEQVIEAYLGEDLAGRPQPRDGVRAVPRPDSGRSCGRDVLKVSEVNAGYGRTVILQNVSLSVGRGEVVTMIGSNGAGKTTLLRAISGLVKPSSGSIEFDGERIDQLVPADIVRRGLIMVPEARQLFPAMTVRDNVLMGCYHPAVRDGATQRFDEVLDIFPRVRERLGQLAGSLSGGEQQMVAIARGLMARPQLLMLDEPSLGLGPIIVQQMFDVIDRICRSGATVLLVEQKAYHALKIADRAYVLENGRIAFENTGAGLLADPHIKTAYLGI